MQNLQNLREWIPTGNPLEAKILQNQFKIPPREQHKKQLKKVTRNHAQTEAQHLPKQQFRLRDVAFLRNAPSPKNEKSDTKN